MHIKPVEGIQACQSLTHGAPFQIDDNELLAAGKEKGWAEIVRCDCKNSPGCNFLNLDLTTGMKSAIKGRTESGIDSNLLLKA